MCVICAHGHTHTHLWAPGHKNSTRHALTLFSGLMAFLLRFEFLKRTACLARENRSLRSLESPPSPLSLHTLGSHSHSQSRRWCQPTRSLLWGSPCSPHCAHTYTQTHSHTCAPTLIHPHSCLYPHLHTLTLKHTCVHTHSFALIHSHQLHPWYWANP